MTPVYHTWSSTALMWSSSRVCSTCCSPGQTEPTRTPWLLASSVCWMRTQMGSSTSGSSSMDWVRIEMLVLCVWSLFVSVKMLSFFLKHVFVGVLYHGDLTEKLKLLYQMHVLPGEFALVGLWFHRKLLYGLYRNCFQMFLSWYFYYNVCKFWMVLQAKQQPKNKNIMPWKHQTFCQFKCYLNCSTKCDKNEILFMFIDEILTGESQMVLLMEGWRKALIVNVIKKTE